MPWAAISLQGGDPSARNAHAVLYRRRVLLQGRSRKTIGISSWLNRQPYASANLYVAVFVDSGKIDAAPRYAGHLLFAGRLPRARIVQVFAAQEFRRDGVATQLVAHVKAALSQGGYISIVARVADDLKIANSFWQRQEFYVQSIEQGGVTTERTILIRSLELPSPQLFPTSGFDAANPLGLQARAPHDVPVFLLDLNVLFDFSPRRLRREQASAIIQAERMNFCRVAVSDEIQKELVRTATPGRTDPMDAFVALFPTFPLANGSDSDPLIRELAALIFPTLAFETLSERALSDLRHVATARQNKLAGLITSDTAILCAAADIWERYAIQILSPEAFTLDGSGKTTTAVENSARSTLVLKELRPEDASQVNQLLSKLGMSGSGFADENAAECVRVFHIPIENQIALAAKEAVVQVGEIPRDLRHPPAVGIGSDTSDPHGAAGDIDEEQDVVCHQSPDRADLDGEKVCRHQAFPVSSEKRRPRHVLIALRGRIDPVFSENVCDRAAPDLMPQIGHGSLDSCIPPRSILKRHAQNEIGDRLPYARPTGASTMAVVPFTCDHFSVPSQEGIRCDQGMKFVQDLASESVRFLASRQRSVSVKRMRRPPRRSLSTRFSSWRYSITSN
jgi:GNAT superfamily N-acetyltransferase